MLFNNENDPDSGKIKNSFFVYKDEFLDKKYILYTDNPKLETE